MLIIMSLENNDLLIPPFNTYLFSTYSGLDIVLHTGDMSPATNKTDDNSTLIAEKR